MATEVPSQFPSLIPTPIAFVGEAPSFEEVAKGQPFVGPSGKIFNAILRIANLERSHYYVGNTFSEQLPDNNVANWTAPLADARAGGFSDFPPIGGSGFLRPEYRHHLDRLSNELRQVSPTVIVPLGGTALWAFTGDTSIGSRRGAVTEAKYLIPGAKLLPTYHPAFVMKQWKMLTTVVGDVMKAAEEAAKGPQIVYPKRKLLLEPSVADIRAYMPKLLGSDLLSVDIETGWGQITCIGFAPDEENAICIPFVDRRKPNRSYWGSADIEVEVWGLVKEVLEAPVPKLGQNYGGYDWYWLLDRMGIRTINMREDTRLLHHALYPELPKSLGFLGTTYGTQGAWKHLNSRAGLKKDD